MNSGMNAQDPPWFILSWSVMRNCCRLHQAQGQRRCCEGRGRDDKGFCMIVYEFTCEFIMVHCSKTMTSPQLTMTRLQMTEWDTNNAEPTTNNTELWQTYKSCNLSIGAILLRYKINTYFSLKTPIFLFIIILDLFLRNSWPTRTSTMINLHWSWWNRLYIRRCSWCFVVQLQLDQMNP